MRMQSINERNLTWCCFSRNGRHMFGNAYQWHKNGNHNYGNHQTSSYCNSVIFRFLWWPSWNTFPSKRIIIKYDVNLVIQVKIEHSPSVVYPTIIPSKVRQTVCRTDARWRRTQHIRWRFELSDEHHWCWKWSKITFVMLAIMWNERTAALESVCMYWTT